MERLKRTLQRIDGRGYKAYKELNGRYSFPDFRLEVDHVQGDPFAAPSRLSVVVPAPHADLPQELWSTPVRRRALEDALGRCIAHAIRRLSRGRRGIGKSGEWRIATSGQQVLTRNAVLLGAEGVEARMTVGLPADGRRILGREAAAMLLEELPRIVRQGMLWKNISQAPLRRQVESVEDQDVLRAWLRHEGLVAFVADGAVLPRRSGVDDRPLQGNAVPFRSPDALARTAPLPHAGPVRGMGIPAGVTVIVGGGFHGKSTLLHALERGVYDHIPGDGRERVAADPTAVKIRAEDGRLIREINISPFIRHLPFGRDTVRFSSENASGSTSQAANIMEALECGARLLLFDEDTSATNFMIRDARMQKLVTAEKEPITPLLHRVRELHERHGVSTIIVMGGSGDYLAAADTVIMLENYRARDVTSEARRIAGEPPPKTARGDLPPLDTPSSRRIPGDLLDPSRGRRPLKIDVRGVNALLYGRHEIDLGRVEQLIDPGQTLAIGLLLHLYGERCSDRTDPAGALGDLLREVSEKGLDLLPPWKRGDLALPRLYEAAAALNRLRSAATG